MSNNAEKLRTKLHRELPFAHPIKEHPIAACEEFVKKLYIDMLCVIAQYENSDTEFALNFVQRIMAGANMKEPVTEHVKNALEITEERFGEFLRQCRENKLENIFVVDAMLISCADGRPSVKQVEFITEISEVLLLNKNHVEFLGNLASVILEQDSEKTNSLLKKVRNAKELNVDTFLCYLKEYLVGVIVDSDELLYLYSPVKKEYRIKDYMDCDTLSRKKIIAENIIFTYDEEAYSQHSEYQYRFSGCESLQLKNCCFSGAGAVALFNISEAIIERTTFEDMIDCALCVSGVTTLHIEKSEFLHCGRSFETRDERGGAILINSCESVELIESRFEECFIENCRPRYNYGVTAPVMSSYASTTAINKCRFSNNKIIGNGNYYATDIYYNGEILLEDNSCGDEYNFCSNRYN